MMSAPANLYFGHVSHRRFHPVRHEFTYNVFSLAIDVDRLDEAGRSTRLFSFERFNLFSFFSKDHGARDGSALRPWVERQLAANGIRTKPAEIRLLCFPRILGFVFNPLSVYFCYDDDVRLFAIVYEVKNTFGGQHAYVSDVAPVAESDHAIPTHDADKAFYVSPFIEMEAHYRFKARTLGERLHLTIDETGAENPILWAGWFGERHPFQDATLLKALVKYPLMTLKVVAAIHWEALRLVLKGAKYRPQPKPAPHRPGTPLIDQEQ